MSLTKVKRNQNVKHTVDSEAYRKALEAVTTLEDELGHLDALTEDVKAASDPHMRAAIVRNRALARVILDCLDRMTY